MKNKEIATISGTESKAYELWNYVTRNSSNIIFDGNVLTQCMNRAAYYLEKAGKLDIAMYDFSDLCKVSFMEFRGCTIDDSTNLIMYDDGYVCRMDDLYYLADSCRVFIIDIYHDNKKNIEFINKMAWKWLDKTLGDYMNVNRKFNWNEPKQNFVPTYVVHTAKLVVDKGKDCKFKYYLDSVWRLVNNKYSKNIMKVNYPNVELLNA